MDRPIANVSVPIIGAKKYDEKHTIDIGGVKLHPPVKPSGKIELQWQAHPLNWPKDWAKLVMNIVLVAVDCLPRGGIVSVETSSDPSLPSFTVVATGTVARLSSEAERALLGEPGGGLDGRSIQPYLTYQLSRGINAGLTTTSAEGEVRFVAG